MDFKERAADILKRHLLEWESNPRRMQSGYDYESTYAEMMQKVEQEVLQLSVGKVPKDKNLKKNSRRDSGK